jgi:hypothetical protein
MMCGTSPRAMTCAATILSPGPPRLTTALDRKAFKIFEVFAGGTFEMRSSAPLTRAPTRARRGCRFRRYCVAQQRGVIQNALDESYVRQRVQ